MISEMRFVPSPTDSIANRRRRLCGLQQALHPILVVSADLDGGHRFISLHFSTTELEKWHRLDDTRK